MNYKAIIITGPTAGGKTRLASLLASSFQGEIISADSRQVYRQMDIGTGKDEQDYWVGGEKVPVHLMNIKDPGYHYNVFEFKRDCKQKFDEIDSKNKPIFIVGGTGMYIQSLLDNYQLLEVPVNQSRRDELNQLNHDELIKYLKTIKKVHNSSDFDSIKRTIRAIEIAEYNEHNPLQNHENWQLESLLFAIAYERNNQRELITQRLHYRLANGMVDEVKSLLDSGLNADELMFYGLEYKFLTRYLIGETSYSDMKSQLNTAIHQFAKRQMTYLRKIEKAGHFIHWIKGELPLETKMEIMNQAIVPFLNSTHSK